MGSNDSIGRSLSSMTFGFIDLETTGLYVCGDSDGTGDRLDYRTSAGKVVPIRTTAIHRIVEIGVSVASSSGDEIEHFESLVNPLRPVPDEAKQVHGITDADVQHSPDALTAIGSALRVLRGADAIFAYNSPFDLRFLVHEHLIRGEVPPELTIYDVARVSVGLGHPRETLASLADSLGVHRMSTHRALADARLAAKTFAALLHDGTSGSRPNTWGDLLSLHNRNVGAYSTGRATSAVLESYSRWFEGTRQRRVRAWTGTVCVTGAIPGISRDDVRRRLDAAGYRYRPEIYEDTDFVVKGVSRAAARKLAAARALGVPIVPAEDFIDWLAAKERTT